MTLLSCILLVKPYRSQLVNCPHGLLCNVSIHPCFRLCRVRWLFVLSFALFLLPPLLVLSKWGTPLLIILTTMVHTDTHTHTDTSRESQTDTHIHTYSQTVSPTLTHSQTHELSYTHSQTHSRTENQTQTQDKDTCSDTYVEKYLDVYKLVIQRWIWLYFYIDSVTFIELRDRQVDEF